MSLRTHPAWPWIVAAWAGVAQAWALAWPWGVAQADWSQALSGTGGWLWPVAGQPWPLLQLGAMVTLVGLLRQAPGPGRAAGLGWVFATAWLAGTFWWLFVSMHTYGGLAAPLAVAAVLALAAALAAYTALISMLFRRFTLYGYGFLATFLNSLLFAGLWALAELARGVWFTGFPWGSVGYAHVNTLAWAAPWIGVYGMGMLVAAGAAWVACARHRVRAWLAVVGVLALGPVWTAWQPDFTEPHGDLPLVLLQGNIAQDEKFLPGSGVPQAMAWYAQRLGGEPGVPPGALVVAPETALPLLPQQMGPEFWEPLLQRLASQSHAVLLGLPLGSHEDGYANGAWGITPVQAAAALGRLAQGTSSRSLDEGPQRFYRYEKHHLVPFGEFVPPLFRWFVDLMAIPLGDFNRGTLGQATLDWGGQRIATNICYEDLFGEELAQSFSSEVAAPTVLVNLSNLGWFGNTVALDQHLHISRLRALELGRPMVRSTNTGATVVINHRAEVTHAQPRMVAGALLASVQGRTGLTPFARWAQRWGLWPVWLLALALAGGAAWAGRRQGPVAGLT